MKRGTQEWKNKLRKSKLGEKNPNWKGDKVGCAALHEWVRRRKPRPNMCEKCNERNAIDLANLSGEYRRDVNDFEWLCRKCHMELDGRIKNLEKGRGFKGKENPNWRGGANNPKISKAHFYHLKLGKWKQERSEDEREEIRKRRSEAQKGRRHTEETKRKISESHKDKKCPWLTGTKNLNWKGGVENSKISKTHFYRLRRKGIIGETEKWTVFQNRKR